MENLYNEDSLKKLLNKILSHQAEDKDIISFCKMINEERYFENIKNNYFILSIYIILKEYNTIHLPVLDTPIIQFTLQSIPARLIFNPNDEHKKIHSGFIGKILD